jgi:hypothetical protein
MIKLELKNHQVWQDLTEILENIDVNVLVREHLTECNYKVCGYWDEQDEYYEEIILPRSLKAELVESYIGVTHTKRFLKLKFILQPGINTSNNKPLETQNIGNLTLVYDENMEFIDEKWLLYIDSPLLEVKRTLDN